MAPRKAENVPPDVRAKLLAAQADAGEAQENLKAAVRYAVTHGGSVRTVAAVLGISPTTVQKWKDET